MLKLRFLRTMDFDYRDILVMNCDTIQELCEKIEKCKIIALKIEKITSEPVVYYVNSSYIVNFRE